MRIHQRLDSVGIDIYELYIFRLLNFMRRVFENISQGAFHLRENSMSVVKDIIEIGVIVYPKS